MNGELGAHGDFEFSRDVQDRVPAIGGVRTVLRALHESNFAVAELKQVLQRQLRRAAMIQQNIGYAFHRTMTRDGDRGQRHRFTEQRVHGNQALDSSLQKNMGIAVQQFLVIMMSNSEKEKAVLA